MNKMPIDLFMGSFIIKEEDDFPQENAEGSQ